MGMTTRRPLGAVLAAALLAACQSTPPQLQPLPATGYAPEFPQLTCAAHGRPDGAPARLTGSSVKAGDAAYIEFRQRLSPGIPSGHLFVVFGRLNAAGEPVTRQYTGLYPKGSVVGLYGGAVVPVPAHLTPNYADCHFNARAAWRVGLSESQYRQLLGKVRAALAQPPLWHMVAFNCNHFAASLGAVAGLQEPANNLLPSFAYIHAYMRANGGA